MQIIKFIKENPKITRKELSEKMNIMVDGVKYNLKKLVDSNILERVGPNNGGYWNLK